MEAALCTPRHAAAVRQAQAALGTRVPLHALFDYLQGGRTLEKFLDDFPTVPKELAIAALQQARRHLIDDSLRRVNAQNATGVEGGNGGSGL